jgi:hypothetical protein
VAIALARRWPSGHYNIDSTTVRAHVSAAGGKEDSSTSSGRSLGGFTSKIHCLADVRGRPIAYHLTPGEAADCKAYETLIDLPEQAPEALLGDKAYDTDDIRNDLRKRRIKPVIPPKSNRRVQTATTKRSTENATGSSASSVISRSAPWALDIISSPTASSRCYISQPPVTGSNLSTPPSRRRQVRRSIAARKVVRCAD